MQEEDDDIEGRSVGAGERGSREGEGQGDVREACEGITDIHRGGLLIRVPKLP